MFKKALATSALFLTSLSAFSAAWQGFYAGGGLGVDTASFGINAHIKKPGDFNAIDKSKLAAQGILANLFGGYSYTYNWFYLAGEFNLGLSTAKFHTSNQESIHKAYAGTTMTMDRNWGLSLLPGVVIIPGDTIIFARLGYTDGRLRIQTSDVSLENVNSMQNGFRYGIGIEKNIHKTWNLRFEYDHINYENYTTKTLDTTSSVTKKAVISPDTNQFELDLIYRFV